MSGATDPVTFSRVRGQDTARRLLASALRADRLYPSYLFAGPDGVGKRLLALEVATALACHRWTMPGDTPPGPSLFGGSRGAEPASDASEIPCGSCGGCGRARRERHPDITIVAPPEGKRLIPLADVREMDSFLRLAPLESRRRVAIVLEADRLGEPAQNALLKTLEEPPRLAHVILVTTTPGKLLPTVLSRCPRVPFGRLDLETLEAIGLAADLSPEDAGERAALARGSASTLTDEHLAGRLGAAAVVLEGLLGPDAALALAGRGSEVATDDPFGAAEVIAKAAVAASASSGDTLEARRQAVMEVLDEANERLRLGLAALLGAGAPGAPDGEALWRSGVQPRELEATIGEVDLALEHITFNVTLERALAGLLVRARVRRPEPRRGGNP